MPHPLANLSKVHRSQLAEALLRLRSHLADGAFLRNKLYTIDESKFAGNTHHYWIRWVLRSDAEAALVRFVPEEKPDQASDWLRSKLVRKLIHRLPSEYSTLIKIPFSVPLGEVAEARERRIASTIKNRLPRVIPYAIFFAAINRLLKSIGLGDQPPSDAEFDMLFAHYCKSAIAKARNHFPEVWDEVRGHYILDSRGAHFAKRLVTELSDRNLIATGSKFVDIGSGIGSVVFAVNHYSAAHATGIEIHPGLISISKVIKRRLLRLDQLDPQRLELLLADAFDTRVVDLSKYDVFYVYSPLGKWEIDIDKVVDRARLGAVIIFNKLPIRNRERVEALKKIAGVFAFQKVRD